MIYGPFFPARAKLTMALLLLALGALALVAAPAVALYLIHRFGILGVLGVSITWALIWMTLLARARS